MNDTFRIVHLAHRSVPTPLGVGSFTDLSLEIGGEVYGARVHGWLGRFDIERFARNTVWALEKERRT